jgi:hypothetical protein
MARQNDSARKARLAAALKENLKRRKAQARAKGAATSAPARVMVRSEPGQGEPRTTGTAPQAGLETAPKPHPNAAPKRP